MKFFFDNNIGKNVSDGLKAFGEDTIHLKEKYDPATEDQIWLAEIGQAGWFLITKDNRIRGKNHELQKIREHKVGAFFLTSKDMGKWDIIRTLVLNWDRIKELAQKTNRPFFYSIRKNSNKIEPLRIT